MSEIRCPGCHSRVAIVGDLIERHRSPPWESYATEIDRGGIGTDKVVIDVMRECLMSGARVRVKR